MPDINQTTVEEAALSRFADLGFATARGQEIAPGEPGAERDSYGDVVLGGRLRAAIVPLNPQIPSRVRWKAPMALSRGVAATRENHHTTRLAAP